jgi:hypothetical protein
MKKFLSRTILLASILAVPAPAMAEVNVHISLPPLIVFASPPEMVVIPETYVYVVPDYQEDIYFYNGWWWRLWEGRWYRSRSYNSGWGYYQRVPSFYTRVPRGWRNDYRDHRWGGQPWNYQRIPQQELKTNWSTWQKTNHWEKQQTWGVQGLKPRAQSKQQPGAVQQKSQARPQSREVQPQRSQPQQREVQPQRSRPQQREVQPQRSQPQQREVQPQRSQPQQREVQPQRSQPQQREVQPQRSQPQQREVAPQRSNPAQGKPEKGQGKPDKGEEDKQDRR